jgi:hypothetical protein
VAVPVCPALGGFYETDVRMQEMRQSAWGRMFLMVALTLLPASRAVAKPSSSSAPSSLLSAAPSRIDFSSVPVGGNSSQTVRVSNTGQMPIIIRKIFAVGGGISVAGLNQPIVLGTGEAVTVNVAFQPDALNKTTGKLVVVGDHGEASDATRLELDVDGEGVTPKRELTVEEDSLDFGSVQTGSLVTRTMRVTNTGNDAVQIKEARVSGQGFVVRGGTGLTLGAGESTELEVSFQPSAPGSREAQLELNSTAENSPNRVPVHGDAERKSDHTVTIRWQNSESETAGQGYYLYRGTAAQGPFTKLNETPLPVAEYTDETLSAGQKYFYVVTTLDNNGNESDFSEPITADVP